jgi:hypothetical protein
VLVGIGDVELRFDVLVQEGPENSEFLFLVDEDSNRVGNRVVPVFGEKNRVSIRAMPQEGLCDCECAYARRATSCDLDSKIPKMASKVSGRNCSKRQERTHVRTQGKRCCNKP